VEIDPQRHFPAPAQDLKSTRLEAAMNEFKKDSIDEEVGGKAENFKGKVKEGAGRVLNDDDLIAEGEADQAAGKVREGVGKVGRNISDLAERAADKLNGDD
jgi:uncharacterized protein YjbJ (UPF0337 family)